MTTENGVYTAKHLYDKTIPPARWVVVDFLGEGTTLLSAAPHAGNSLLALQLAIAVAKGEPFLGTYQTVKGSVLYVNSDDPNERRLQENLHRLGGQTEGLSFLPSLPELDNGGLEILDEILTAKAQTYPHSLLVLDSLMTLIRSRKGNSEFMEIIVGFGRNHNCSILVISHSPKGSRGHRLGTPGIAAAVDASMLLTGADDTKKLLQAKGRGISPFEVHLELQVEDRSGWLVVDGGPPAIRH